MSREETWKILGIPCGEKQCFSSSICKICLARYAGWAAAIQEAAELMKDVFCLCDRKDDCLPCYDINKRLKGKEE